MNEYDDYKNKPRNGMTSEITAKGWNNYSGRLLTRIHKSSKATHTKTVLS